MVPEHGGPEAKSGVSGFCGKSKKIKASEKSKKTVDTSEIFRYTTVRVDGLQCGITLEAWLSLVERCVRDAEVACSNHVASIIMAL